MSERRKTEVGSSKLGNQNRNIEKSMIRLLACFAILTLLVQCKQTVNNNSTPENNTTNKIDNTTTTYRNYDTVYGTVEILPEGITIISPMVGGFIKKINHQTGEKVYKGMTLAILEHPNYIKLQEDYLSSVIRLEQYKQEYKRQGQLTLENAAPMKILDKAKADYLSTEVHVNSLALQLQQIGIDPDSVSIDNIKTTIELKSPVNGIISNIQAKRGQLIGDDLFLCEIADVQKMVIRLTISDKKPIKFEKEKKYQFELLNRPGKQITGKIYSIRKNNDSVYIIDAKIIDKNAEVFPGEVIKAYCPDNHNLEK